MSNVSIIMPLFNAEKYLPEAIQSVLKQTYRDFELICIDDCSTDRTGSIVEEFRKKDTRIRMLANEQHSGAAFSRNWGLKSAEGEYIVFLDGDDIFEEELLEKACGAMERYQADVILFEYLHTPSETIYMKRTIERAESFSGKYCKVPFSMDDFEPRDFLWWADSPCNRMLRRCFLTDNRLEFQNLLSSNDVYFAQMSLFCAKRIVCLDDRRVMVYARDHSEPQRISNRRNPMCSYDAMEQLCRKLKERDMIGQYAPYLYYRLPAYFMYVLRLEKNEEYKRSFYDFLHKKGISKCVEYGKEYYSRLDEYDRYLLESFQTHAYESRWFDHPDTYFQCHLKKNGDRISSYIKKGISEHRKIILWGVGTNGKILLRYLSERSIRISGIADRDRAKQGTVVDGYEIADPVVSVREADDILVTSKELFQEISSMVKNTKTVVTDLLGMLLEGERSS